MNTDDAMRDWADMRMFLAIADQGSLVAAAEHLDLTQPTLGRRLAALQKRLGVTLFIRSGRRLVPSDAGMAIMDSARRMQHEMHAIRRSVDVSASGLCGVVTISATEGTGTEWLPPVLFAFKQQYPDITINLLIESRAVDIVQREADIALRLGEPTQPDLIAKRLVQIGFGWYASPKYLAGRPAIAEETDLAQHQVVGLQFAGEPPRVTPGRTHALDTTDNFALITNSPAAQLSAVRAGYGVGAISHRWAAMYPELERVLPEHNVGEATMWIVTHADLRHSARIRAVYDYLVERVREAEHTFTGASS
ncbi:MAG: LysR family transcriptional regulator [Pseudomonadota bacterium]